MSSRNDISSSPFKMIVMVAFMAFAVLGVIAFAMYQAKSGSSDMQNVVMWGTIPESQMNVFITEFKDYDQRIENLQYTYVPAEEFDNKLINALASGYGPDIVLLNNEQIMQNRDRLYITPYENYDVRSYKQKYTMSSESLLLPEGIIGFPVLVDPLVLYWNRTLLSINQYTLPPAEWSELFKMSQKITRKDDAGNIETSTIALGETSNILHAKDIYISMLMQAGGNVVKTDSNNNLIPTLEDRGPVGTIPAQDALRFYTEFSNPNKSVYTWSRSLPLDRDAFVSGDLAMYIGYASELPLVLKQNPNLNFDVARLPHLNNGNPSNMLTYARVYALAVPRVSQHPNSAWIMVDMLSTPDASSILSSITGLPSAQNSLLAVEPKDALQTTFRNSAIVSKTWLDPNPVATQNIIYKMINNVVIGKTRLSEAVAQAQRELQALLGTGQ